jgi:hypothetical protein
MKEAGWFYACRTAKNTVATWREQTFTLDLLGDSLQTGKLI